MDFIQFPHLVGKYVLVLVCMFSHRTAAFSCRQATGSSVAKSLLEKTLPAWPATPDSTVIRKPIRPIRSLDESVLLDQLRHFHCIYHPHPSGLVGHTKGIIKIQLTKSVDTLQVP